MEPKASLLKAQPVAAAAHRLGDRNSGSSRRFGVVNVSKEVIEPASLWTLIVRIGRSIFNYELECVRVKLQDTAAAAHNQD